MANEAATDTDTDTGKLWSLIREVRIAMMTTEDDGVLRSRPMAALPRESEGTLWFFTRADSEKIVEISEDRRVNLSFSDPSAQNYVSVSGRGSLVRDRAEIAALWTEAARVWFPKGKDDPEIALLKVTVEQGEYWDAPSSTMLHAYGYVKAVLTGQPPQPGGHGIVGKADLPPAITNT